MADEQMVNAMRSEVDEAVFAAVEDVSNEMASLSRRERLQLTLQISERVMYGIDQLSESAKRSEAGRKAAQTRYSKPKPTPGPAIPPAQTNAAQSSPPVVLDQGAAAPTLPPPPHPALMPQGAGTGPQPFGAPPA